MSQRNSGLYSFVGRSGVYSFIQNVLVPPATRRTIIDRYIRAAPGDKIVEIGCGTAPLLPYLGDVDYLGIDPEQRYVEGARETHGAAGVFVQGYAEDIPRHMDRPADIVLIIAVLHHLSDAEARTMFRVARQVLKPGGRLVTLDCVWTTPQNPIARLLIHLDRGRNTRTAEGYRRLAEGFFARVDSDLRTDLLRVPYTHFMMECA